MLLHILTVFIATLILVDFILPGKVFTENVTQLVKTKQRYYNAAGNYHYSYKIITPNHHFSVSKNFAKTLQNNPVIITESVIFKEINTYKIAQSNTKNTYSFRLASGLALPIVVIITLCINYYYKKLTILIAVLQIVLLGNLIHLLL